MNKAYSFIKARDSIMRGIFLFCAVFSIFALGCICVFLFANGAPFIGKVGPRNFFGATWNLHDEAYGILPMIVASLYVTALATMIGVAVGLFTAIGLYKFCPKKAVAPIRQMINLLAGIPSVIYGLFGMIVIVPFLRETVSPNGIGYGILAASLVLSVMVLPTIVSVSLDALNAVPKSYFEGALALGATKPQSVFRVMVPAAKSGILAAVVLSIGRSIGETMAVIMVIGGEEFALEKAPNCTHYVVCKDGIAVIVNKDNPLDNITLDELMNIYDVDAGPDSITVWNEIIK